MHGSRLSRLSEIHREIKCYLVGFDLCDLYFSPVTLNIFYLFCGFSVLTVIGYGDFFSGSVWLCSLFLYLYGCVFHLFGGSFFL